MNRYKSHKNIYFTESEYTSTTIGYLRRETPLG